MNSFRTEYRQGKKTTNKIKYYYSKTPREPQLMNNNSNYYYSSKISIHNFFLYLLKDIKRVLVSFFKLYIKQYNTRKKILLHNLLEKRNNSAKIIQDNYIVFLLRKDLFSLAKKHKNYYSVYPSFISGTKYKQKVRIKIYTDLTNSKKYSILPVRYCLIRNCYVFDIPKNKFPGNKKIMRFNFISEDDDRIIDPGYKKVIFGGKCVNEIDFKKSDKNTKLIKKDVSSNSSSALSDSDFDDNQKYNNDLRNIKTETKITDNFYDKTLSNLLTVKTKQIKNENDLTNSTMSTKCSPRFNNENKKRKGSILKKTHSFAVIKNRKRVSFGFVKFSY